MSFKQLYMNRHAVHKFGGKEGPPISKEMENELLEAARWAPTAGNMQPVRYVVIRDQETKKQLQELAAEAKQISGYWEPRFRDGGVWGEVNDLIQPELLIAVLTIPTEVPPNTQNYAVDMMGAAITMEHMWLAATEMDLQVGCYCHWLTEKVKVLLNVPLAWNLAGIMAFGYSIHVPKMSRKPLDGIVFYEKVPGEY
ncbi:MAG: hypothetical protein APF84_11010 [Gracilibacter sp. BRH_c7a]|nr:MAG: hypothetical protein APF84_11010 [Gracilibacter sp. BRH_c7a]